MEHFLSFLYLNFAFIFQTKQQYFVSKNIDMYFNRKKVLSIPKYKEDNKIIIMFDRKKKSMYNLSF